MAFLEWADEWKVFWLLIFTFLQFYAIIIEFFIAHIGFGIHLAQLFIFIQ